MHELKQLFETIQAELSAGRALVLCTILRSSGSAPRHEGSRMALLADGSFIGTVGGGAVERESQVLARDLLQKQASQIQNYRLHENAIADIGMICGGDVDIFFQYMDAVDSPFCSQLLDALAEHKKAWIVLEFSNDILLAQKILTEHSEEISVPPLPNKPIFLRKEHGFYAEPLLRAEKVYIFGAGHVGQALCPILTRAGFSVHVFDTREEILTAERLPDAEALILGDYADIGSSLSLNRDDFIVILTPGHTFDYAATHFALSSPAKYVGCIGSRRKVLSLQHRLADAGISQERIADLHAPIGLPIGGETPAEIAISIAAELIAVRNGSSILSAVREK